MNLLCASRGYHGITMKCLIRVGIANVTPRTEVPIPGVDRNDVLAAKTTLHGLEFDKYNTQAYTMLHSTLIGKPGM